MMGDIVELQGIVLQVTRMSDYREYLMENPYFAALQAEGSKCNKRSHRELEHSVLDNSSDKKYGWSALPKLEKS